MSNGARFAVEAHDLVKVFPRGNVRALDGVSLQVEAGPLSPDAPLTCPGWLNHPALTAVLSQRKAPCRTPDQSTHHAGRKAHAANTRIRRGKAYPDACRVRRRDDPGYLGEPRRLRPCQQPPHQLLVARRCPRMGYRPAGNPRPRAPL